METLTADVEDVEWILVEESSAAGRVRRAATAIAQQLGFSEHRVGEIAIAATELATNLHRHAVAGVIVLRVRRRGDEGALELVVTDTGPGMTDLRASENDGESSAGTLGIGLGAAMRIATRFDSHSVPQRGTVMYATFWRDREPPQQHRVAALTRPIATESVCGDAWALREDGAATMVMLADGLGHGELAATASRAAARAFEAAPGHDTAAALSVIDKNLRATRGAAVAAVRIDWAAGRLTFAGIGNIAVWIDDGERRRGLASTPGIVGHNARKFREFAFDLAPDAIVILHSDGLTAKWDLNDYPGLRARDPHLIAATLMRDAAIRHDDSSIVVAKAP